MPAPHIRWSGAIPLQMKYRLMERQCTGKIFSFYNFDDDKARRKLFKLRAFVLHSRLPHTLLTPISIYQAMDGEAIWQYRRFLYVYDVFTIRFSQSMANC